MAINPLYMINWALIPSILDKDTGLPLASGTVEFYQDDSRATPKPVYELTGTQPDYTYTALPNPVSLNASGQPVNASNAPVTIYLYPFDSAGEPQLYYMIVKDSSGNVKFTQEGWPNLSDDSPISVVAQGGLDNQISNPQFEDVFINVGFNNTYTVSGTETTFAFAPDWDFVIDGTGSVVVSRTATAGSSHIEGNPPYVVTVSVDAGITKCWLRQRFGVNSGLWSSTTNRDVYLAGGVIAQAIGSDATISMFYTESTGLASDVQVVSGTATTGGFTYLRGTSDLLAQSNNTDTGEDGYVDIYLSFPASSSMRVSNVQVLPVNADNGGDLIDYKINSTDRNTALAGGFYIPDLQYRPMGNILTGWDFRVNPGQLGSSGTVPLISGADYILDQTIAGCSTGASSYVKTSVGALQITTSGANEVVMLATYLTGEQAYNLIGSKLSLNCQVYRGSVGSADDVTLRAYVCFGTTGANIPTLPTLIGSINTSGELTVSASNWAEVPRGGLPYARGDIPVLLTGDTLNTDYDLKFSGWEMTDASTIGSTDKVCVIVTAVAPTSGTQVRFQSINLCNSQIPSRPIPESPDEALRKCQYYYEQSYNIGVAPGTVTDVGTISRTMLAFNSDLGASWRPGNFEFSLRQEKIAVPTITFYDPELANTTATGRYYYSYGSNATSALTTTSGQVSMTSGRWAYHISEHNVFGEKIADTSAFNTALVNGGSGAWLNFHYKADARLGK